MVKNEATYTLYKRIKAMKEAREFYVTPTATNNKSCTNFHE